MGTRVHGRLHFCSEFNVYQCQIIMIFHFSLNEKRPFKVVQLLWLHGIACHEYGLTHILSAFVFFSFSRENITTSQLQELYIFAKVNQHIRWSSINIYVLCIFHFFPILGLSNVHQFFLSWLRLFFFSSFLKFESKKSRSRASVTCELMFCIDIVFFCSKSTFELLFAFLIIMVANFNFFFSLSSMKSIR